MSNIDFENGFLCGLATRGIVTPNNPGTSFITWVPWLLGSKPIVVPLHPRLYHTSILCTEVTRHTIFNIKSVTGGSMFNWIPYCVLSSTSHRVPLQAAHRPAFTIAQQVTTIKPYTKGD